MNSNNKHNTYNTLFHWHSFRIKLIFEGIAIGIITGLLIVMYRYALTKAGVFLAQTYNFIYAKPIIVPGLNHELTNCKQIKKTS